MEEQRANNQIDVQRLQSLQETDSYIKAMP